MQAYRVELTINQENSKPIGYTRVGIGKYVEEAVEEVKREMRMRYGDVEISKVVATILK